MKRTALYAALAAAFGPAWAQEQDPEIAALTRPESEISAGLGYWSKDRPRLGTYDGMNQKGFYTLFDAFINRRDDASGTWFILDARNLGLETREMRAEWLRQGDLGVFLEYSRTPRDEPYTVYTAVQGIGTTTQRVPSPSATPAALGELHLGTVRDALGAGFNKYLGGGYDFRVSFKNEDKKGDRLWGRGGAPEFAAEPIDSTTRQLEAVLGYTGRAFQVQGGYYGSWYTNRNSMVDTALTTGASQFFLSLPLDNEAHQFFVNGGYNLSERTRATFKAAYTRATQDEEIPVGSGTGFPPIASAPTHLDGRIDNTLLQAGLSSRTSPTFSWLANLRYYESDEKTPQVRIVEPAGGCGTGTCVDNTPLRFETLTGRVEGTYRMAQNLSVTAGLAHAKQERDVPMGHLNAGGEDAQRYIPWRAEVDETTWRLELRRSLAQTVNGRLVYLHAKRDGSEFTPAAADAPQANLINPIHIADRDRDKLGLALDWAPLEPLTLTFVAERAKDEYGHSDTRPYGLREGAATLLSIDAAYVLSERWQVNAWYTRDHTEATQVGQRNANGGAAEAVKEANLEDIGNTFGAGVRGVLMPRLKAGLDFLYSKNVNKYPETITLTGAGTVFPASGAVTAAPLPDITNKMTRINLYGLYALQKNSEVRVDYIYERWTTDDWSWMFADGSTFTYGATTDGTQVVQGPRQIAHFVGARYIYRFQ